MPLPQNKYFSLVPGDWDKQRNPPGCADTWSRKALACAFGFAWCWEGDKKELSGDPAWMSWCEVTPVLMACCDLACFHAAWQA